MNNNWVLEIPTEFGSVSVAVHPGPHVDELLAILIIQEAATREFVQNHQHETVGLGVEGGPYDEHPREGQPRKAEECTATLVAKKLGIHQDPLWSRLLRYAYWVDQGEPMPRQAGDTERAYPEEWNHVLDVNNLFKLRWRELRGRNQGSVPAEKGIDYVTRGLGDLRLFWKQQQDFIRAWEEIRARGREMLIDGHDKQVKVILLRSDDLETNAAARSFARADLVVRRSSSGNVQIFRARQAQVGLDDLAQVLIVRELALQGKEFKGDWRDLCQEGDGPCGVWYYYRPHGMLLNGSEQHEKPPTAITDDDELMELIKVALSADYYPPSMAAGCRAGICLHLAGHNCPFFDYGLKRCRKIQYWERKGRPAAGELTLTKETLLAFA